MLWIHAEMQQVASSTSLWECLINQLGVEVMEATSDQWSIQSLGFQKP